MSEIEIRPFEERERAELRELFGRAGEGAPTASIWGHEESEADVYLTPYMDLEPESLFVAVEDGELVGYLAGCLDTARLPSESDRLNRAITKHRLFLRRKPAAFFARAVLDMAISAVRRAPTAGEFDDPRWPAHLHINVLPRVRGAGVAAALMDRWLKVLRETGSRGCHLQTLVENSRAVRFFARMGFEKYGPTPMVPGLRYQGRRVHQQTMVWAPNHARRP
jgi:ribosomal protein S18 acetylase RimI-like enzyme